MKRYRTPVILLNLAFLLAYMVYATAGKEQLLKNGELVLLELAPVDPRSRMQGDYMRLSYRMANDAADSTLPKRGYCVVTLDSSRVAALVRVQPGREPLEPGERLIEMRLNARRELVIGAESFFFQEGRAAAFDSARYGALRVDRNGNSVLTGLYDRSFTQLK